MFDFYLVCVLNMGAEVVSLVDRVQRYYRGDCGNYIVDVGDISNPIYLGVRYSENKQEVKLELLPFSQNWVKITESMVRGSIYSKILELPRKGETTLILAEREEEIIMDIVYDPHINFWKQISAEYHVIYVDEDEIDYTFPEYGVNMFETYETILLDSISKLTSYRGQKNIERKLKSIGFSNLIEDYQREKEVILF